MDKIERFKYYIKNWQDKQDVLVPEFARIFKRNHLFFYEGLTMQNKAIINFQDGSLINGWWWDQGTLSLNIPCLTISSDGIENHQLPTIAKVRYINNQFGSILAPLEYGRHWGLVEKAKSVNIPWKDKINSCVWRGTPTGRIQDFGNEPALWQNQRMRLCYNYRDKYDVGIFQNMFDLWDTNYLKPELSVEQMINFKYIISIDGNDKDSGLNWKLASNSLVLMSNPVVESWLMEGLLKPYVHYVPLNDDQSDLDNILEWCKLNDEKCEEIVKNANDFMKQFEDFKIEHEIFDMIKNHYKNTFTFL